MPWYIALPWYWQLWYLAQLVFLVSFVFSLVRWLVWGVRVDKHKIDIHAFTISKGIADAEEEIAHRQGKTTSATDDYTDPGRYEEHIAKQGRKTARPEE